MIEGEIGIEHHHPHAGAVDRHGVSAVCAEQLRHLLQQAQMAGAGRRRRPGADGGLAERPLQGDVLDDSRKLAGDRVQGPLVDDVEAARLDQPPIGGAVLNALGTRADVPRMHIVAAPVVVTEKPSLRTNSRASRRSSRSCPRRSERSP